VSKIDDGGAAFPMGIPEGANHGHGLHKQQGMTLRDYFAAAEKIDCDETFTWELCEALAGKRPEKDRKSDPVAWEIWQATWQAKIKFIRANAMLAARKEAQP